MKRTGGWRLVYQPKQGLVCAVDPQERGGRNTVGNNNTIKLLLCTKSDQHSTLQGKNYESLGIFAIESPHPHEISAQKYATGGSVLQFCTKSVRLQRGKYCCLLL